MPTMNSIYFWLTVLSVGLFVLIKAADYFNKASEVIGISFGMPPFIIGVLITSIGTSLPEMITSTIAVVQGASEIVPGNVVGSNIANIFLILGIVTIVHRKPIHLTAAFITVDLQFLIGSALFLTLTLVDGNFSLFEGILSLAAFGVYFIYLLLSFRNSPVPRELSGRPQKALLKYYAQFLLSGLLMYGAGNMVIKSVVFTAEFYEIGVSIVAAGVVSFGTSLPELVVSLNAVKNGKSDYAIGNILGSSIFNSFWVMGFASLFGIIAVTDEIIYLVLPVMLIATFLFFMLTRDKLITIWEGALFLLFYILYISKLIA